ARAYELEDLLASPHFPGAARADELVPEEEEPLVVAWFVLDLDDRLGVGLLLGRHAHDRDVRVEHPRRVRWHLDVRRLRAEHVLRDSSTVVQGVVPRAHAVVAP